MFDAMTFLLVTAELVIAILQRLACFDKLLVDEQALIEIGLALGFEIGQRRLTRRKLLCEFGLARIELRELAVHALHRLLQRGQCGASGFESERELMLLVGGLAGVHARFLARFEQAATFAVEMLAMLFLIAHARDSFFQARARLAGRRLVCT